MLQTEPGDNPRIRLKGIEEEDIRPGFVLCDPSRPCNVAKEFDCQLLILEHKSIVCAGYSAIIHVQSCVEEVVIEVRCRRRAKGGGRSRAARC